MQSYNYHEWMNDMATDVDDEEADPPVRSPRAWCFMKSLVQKLQWQKPVGGDEVLRHWTPLYTQADIDAAVEAMREKCIDIVAMHGGSVEIEAAIRGA